MPWSMYFDLEIFFRIFGSGHRSYTELDAKYIFNEVKDTFKYHNKRGCIVYIEGKRTVVSVALEQPSQQVFLPREKTSQ